MVGSVKDDPVALLCKYWVRKPCEIAGKGSLQTKTYKTRITSTTYDGLESGKQVVGPISAQTLVWIYGIGGRNMQKQTCLFHVPPYIIFTYEYAYKICLFWRLSQFNTTQIPKASINIFRYTSNSYVCVPYSTSRYGTGVQEMRCCFTGLKSWGTLRLTVS
jgi:hypothetical protein